MSDTSRPTWDQVWLDVAASVARRSLCVRDQVGAVIVSPSNRLISSGYNNPPAGFNHRSQLCRSWCERSRPRVTWVPSSPETPTIEYSTGADGLLRDVDGNIIDDPYQYFVSQGYKRVEELSPCYDDCVSLHAEANAIAVCDRTQREDGILYTTSHVCWNCAKLIANSGLSSVCYPAKLTLTSDDVGYRNPDRSYEFLESCGIVVYTV